MRPYFLLLGACSVLSSVPEEPLDTAAAPLDDSPPSSDASPPSDPVDEATDSGSWDSNTDVDSEPPDLDDPVTDTDPSPSDTEDSDLPSDTIPPADTDPAPDTDATAPWSHTVTVDGDLSDWTVGTELETTAGSTATHHVSWDDTTVYVAARHPDVGLSPLHWWVLVLGDGSQGTTTGLMYNSQQPTLSFPASMVIRWKSDGSWNGMASWSGTDWSETPLWLGTDGSQVASNGTDTVELSIPRSTLPSSETLGIHLRWLYEGSGSESTYGATPTTSLTEGYDPDITSWLVFDLQGATPPNQQAPTP